jgi:sarcosine/dimethylglycine N-methyltransferase
MTATQKVTEVTQAYYDSSDADAFYFHVWGGEDIHIGLYESPTDTIATASQRTVRRMSETARRLARGRRVLDCGSGYGGAARWLAQEHGVNVVCLNLSGVQNDRNRALTAEAGLTDRIEVVDGTFENIDLPDGSVDCVWSQDAILHSGDKARVFSEIHRVLAPNGELVFTDPMQADDCPDGVLGEVLARIHLDSMGSFALYRRLLGELGMVEGSVVDHTPHLVTHYTRVGEALDARRDALARVISTDYLDRMRTGLSHWVHAGQRGYLAWGIMRFVKPA